ncbi:MAG: GntR family transcriptional regulator [Rhodospirillales bacterium]
MALRADLRLFSAPILAFGYCIQYTVTMIRSAIQTPAPGQAEAGTAEAGLRLSRRGIPAEIAESLRRRILSGELADGMALRQAELAEAYGVSRIPVREALQRLQAEGLVVIATNKGARVSGLAPEEIAELYALRACLEGELAERAAARLMPKHLQAMEAALTAYEAALGQEEIGAWGTLNWGFHKALLEAADRPLWLEELRAINDRTERYVRLQLALTGALRKAQEDHRRILELARGGEAQALGRLMRSHIEEAGQALVATLLSAQGGQEPGESP